MLYLIIGKLEEILGVEVWNKEGDVIFGILKQINIMLIWV